VDPEDDLLILKLQADVRGPVGGGDEDQAALEEPVRLEGEAEVLTVDAGAEAVLYEGAVLEVVSRGDSDGARGGLGPLPRADGAVDVGRVAEGRDGDEVVGDVPRVLGDASVVRHEPGIEVGVAEGLQPRVLLGDEGVAEELLLAQRTRLGGREGGLGDGVGDGIGVAVDLELVDTRLAHRFVDGDADPAGTNGLEAYDTAFVQG